MPAGVETDLLLIAGASGKQSTHLLRQIAPKWKHLRLLAHSDNSVQRLKEHYPNAEVEKANLFDRADCARVLNGVTAVWYLFPAFGLEVDVGHTFIDAAVKESKKPESKFRHLVFSSVLQTQLRKLLHHDAKRYVEEYLMESGLQFTILQPSHFLNNFPMAMLAKQDHPKYPTYYDIAHHGTSFTILEDYAEAAAKVLEEREKHYYAQYPLVSTFPIPYSEIVDMASEIIGKKIDVEIVPLDKFAANAVRGMTGDDPGESPAMDAAERMFLYYQRRGLVCSPSVMEWLLGRKPTDARTWLQRQVEEARQSDI